MNCLIGYFTTSNLHQESEKRRFLLTAMIIDYSVKYNKICQLVQRHVSKKISPITYHWTMPLILDHSYLFGKLTSSKIAATKVSGF